jgi:hypothetical protein
MRWTKKDIRTMCGTLSTFWLYNRPLGDSLSASQGAAAEVREFLKVHRKEAVLAGLQDRINVIAGRAEEYAKTAKHYADHPEVMGSSTSQMIDRFNNLAEMETRDVDKLNVIIERIGFEGLPPEVVDFDPTAPAR